jgi:hypothetical protein
LKRIFGREKFSFHGEPNSVPGCGALLYSWLVLYARAVLLDEDQT